MKKKKLLHDICEDDNNKFIDSGVIKRKENRIYIYGPIDEEMAFNVVALLNEISDDLDFAVENDIDVGYDDIEIHLNSEGGIVYDALGIYDAIVSISEKYDVKISCIGRVMSAGFLILSAGTKGLRFAGRNTTFMLHQVQISQMTSGISEIENELQESNRLQDIYIDIVSSHSKVNKTKLNKIIKDQKNYYFDAKKALELGFIDGII